MTKRKFVNLKANRVDFLDERFYEVADGVYYPSVTHILNLYPKGPFFEQWLKDVGASATSIADRAAESGSKVHQAIEGLVAGDEIEWDDKYYDFDEWSALCRFKDFYDRFNPDIFGSEVITFSNKHKYAGTIDLIFEMQDKLWLVDLKFSNYIHDTYFLQLAAYVNSFNEHNDKKIDRFGILWLKAQTRTLGSKGAIQGIGWQLKEPKQSFDELFGEFERILGIYYFKNPNPRPKFLTLPYKIKL